MHPNFLDRIASAFKISEISFFPHTPPNASTDDLPPILLPISVSYTPRTAQEPQSRVTYYQFYPQNTKEHVPQIYSCLAV